MGLTPIVQCNSLFSIVCTVLLFLSQRITYSFRPPLFLASSKIGVIENLLDKVNGIITAEQFKELVSDYNIRFIGKV